MFSNRTDHRWFWLTVLLISFALLWLLAPILTPFILGALLAYLGDPLVDRMEKKMPRAAAVSVVFLAFFTLVFIVIVIAIPILETQLKLLINNLPNYIESVLNLIQPYMKRELSVDTSIFELDRVKKLLGSHWNEAGGIIRSVIAAISQSGLWVVAWLGNAALTPVVAFYMLRDWDYFISYIHDMLPRNIEPTITQLAKESDEVLASFLRGQLSVMMALSVIYSIGLWLVGLDIALLVGLLAGIVSFVPYLGLIIGILVAGIAMLFQTGSFIDVGFVMLVFSLAQVVEGFLLTPWLVGKNIGLHPVTVIFAVLAGGQVFGFFGVLLALPVAAIIAVILRHLHHSYKESQIYRF